ncbi:NUMOD4 domain-containing protein [Planococcus sp. NCCP-2050]|uniref:NUMOD4 domain-containing protein n=1 Tax=Planococcus sp. NCCP-2050 TaxID=2944679 RepID=UPI0020406CDC|nr:NUMOD4 domain-containing protein [Planococcus sp. NCCP-2050]GKW45877.1 hypothetical protein NCCP2050_15690 [Planococcus sp. NCCP-2050]
MKEEHRAIKNYEGLYDITVSGKVFSYARNRYLARKEDEYGFHIVKLSKKGLSTNFKVFQIWKEAFPELNENMFKGTKIIKYK